MSAVDLPTVKRWLATPHVMQWWGEPDEQFGLVSGDLDEPAMDQFVVETDGRLFGYLQCYRLADWNTGLGPHPDGTRGIDMFIADPQMLGRGHGAGLIRSFADRLLESGTPRVVTDPDPGNARAIRTYEKAGFVRERLVDTPDGVSLLMIRDGAPDAAR
jgi:aminoglycoside 6'-N-acetyltransferase